MIRTLLRPAPRIALGAFLLASCAKTSACGCLGTLAPLAAPLDSAHVTQAGAQAYLTPAAFDFLDNNFQNLVTTLMPNGLTFWVPETEKTAGCVSFFGCAIDEFICRASDCPSAYAGGDCTQNGAQPNGACPVAIVLDSLQTSRTAPNELDATLTFNIDFTEFGYGPSGSCDELGAGSSCRNTIWLGGTFGCSPGLQLTLDQKQVPITLKLLIDPVSQALTIDVTNVGVSLSGSDFGFNCGGGLGSLESGVLNFFSGTIASFLNGQIQSMIQSQVGKQLDKQFCMTPAYYTGGCPSGSVTGQDRSGEAACCAPGTSCANGQGDGCIAKPLGLVGTLNAGNFLSKFGAPAAPLQLEIFPGQAVDSATLPLIAQNGGGLTARVVTGVEALSPSTCVPSRPAPTPAPPSQIDFDSESQKLGLASYMVGVGLSQAFLDQAAYEAYNAGALCLDIDSYNESLITTSVLVPILPSLANIAPNAPAYAVLRPQNPPTVTVGAGTIQNGQIVNPLLTLAMKDLRIDLFATVDERPVRLFAISADVSLPLALGVGPSGSSIQILMGSFSNVLVNLNATGENILAEPPSQILKLIPLVLQLAGPKLAALPNFNLPSLAGFDLTIDGIGGIVADGDGGYQDVGLFADLTSAPPGAWLPGGAAPSVRIAENLEPALSDVSPGGTLTRWPTAVLAVDQQAGPTETSFSVEGGLWSPYVRGGLVVVSTPLFLIQGHHAIEVRTRPQGSRADGFHATLDFVSDYTPPAISLTRDEAGRFALSATDNLTPAAQLEWATSIAGAPFSPFAQGIPDPNALAAQGAFRVEARDAVGNVSVADSAGLDPTAGGAAEGGSSAEAPARPSSGCGTAPGAGGWAALGLLALGLVTRRRRRC
ncbi:MAG: MYXO-CTERM sorting domain-containing protein [Deltaproteobacteria bacterium]